MKEVEVTVSSLLLVEIQETTLDVKYLLWSYVINTSNFKQ